MPRVASVVFCGLLGCHWLWAAEPQPPYAGQVAEYQARLRSDDAATRSGAAEALGFMRACEARDDLLARLQDPSPLVRREAALALAWCGDRQAVTPLIDALGDEDWVTRQAAHVSLTNLTGLEFPFDSLTERKQRSSQTGQWRNWWASVPEDGIPREVLGLIETARERAGDGSVAASSVETEINGKRGTPGSGDDDVVWRVERGLRALGTLGGDGATEAVLACLGPAPSPGPGCELPWRAGIRALGRLRDEAGFQALIRLLDQPYWARYAAEALGDFGDRRAVPALLAAYPRYAKQLDGKDPAQLPADDKMKFPSEDRMLETPYAMIYALCRLPLDHPQDQVALRRIAPQLMANLPGDHDTFMLYEREVGHRLTHYLMEKAGLRQEACEQAFEQLGQPRRVPCLSEPQKWSVFPAYRISSWLPAVCTDAEDLPRLITLLQHEEGWVRLNAAKTLAWIGDTEAIEPITRRLVEAKAEADFGYSGTFKDEEYNDPAPRWREGLVRALGLLAAHDQTSMIVHILNDERSVLEVRHAAAEALADLGNEMALGALRDAAYHHSFHSVRQVANDALRYRGIELPPAANAQPTRPPEEVAEDGSRKKCQDSLAGNRTSGCFAQMSPDTFFQDFDAVVFIKGNNSIPNTMGTVEQADRWRQTYVVTDSGPVYRPGRNLYVLRPVCPDGKVTPLTPFEDGYVGDLELSWDALHAIFCHRGEEDPWWHIYRIRVDGTGLEQLTQGPYHDVGPAILPDGRIVFATTRSGIRDEYHGYPCTALWVMNPDGTDMAPIATNIGRDNEPAVLLDGRIAFSRLEVFYSRNKTELTLHAIRPDGTQDRVLYGPERRAFWRQLDHGPRTPADGQEAPLTHRVLRMSQPQPMPNGRQIVVVTQGGLILVGLRRDEEEFITPDYKTRSYTTPFPLPDGRLMCASTMKVEAREKVDLGLYLFDPKTKKLEMLYNDPATADFEPRPVLARRRPPALPDHTTHQGYRGRFVCASVFETQEPHVRTRGRLVRLIEGVPVVSRHSTHTNDWPVWKNHGGTFARVLGTAPLAPDGSFFVETPADRLLHFQVLDSDRRVVGNQRTWIYPRPGETRSCVGCHEVPDSTIQRGLPLAQQYPPLPFLPHGDEFRYRAKAWFKGHLPDKIEERTRTVRAVNLLGR
ncbi:MAG: HEAT repeat domain-containing protein [Pirellulaceae bacterium]